MFSKFIYAWYDDGFRKVFMQPPDRPGVRLLKKHIISLLAGDVFNRAFALPPLYLLLFFARLGPPHEHGHRVATRRARPAAVGLRP